MRQIKLDRLSLSFTSGGIEPPIPPGYCGSAAAGDGGTVDAVTRLLHGGLQQAVPISLHGGLLQARRRLLPVSGRTVRTRVQPAVSR